MIKGIGHVGVAVKNIEEVIGSLSKALALPVPPIRDILERKVKVAVLEIGGTGLGHCLFPQVAESQRIELLLK